MLYKRKIAERANIGFRAGQAKDLRRERPTLREDLQDNAKAQTKEVFEKIKHVLEAGGATFKDVVKVTAFLTNKEDYPAYNEVRKEYFADNFPASSTVIVKDLVVEGMRVEVEVIAAL